MKVLFPVLDFTRSGGMRVLSKIADGMIAQGHEVLFLAPDGSQDPYFPTTAPVLKYGVWLQNIPVLRMLSKVLGMYLTLRKVKNDYDVVVANYNITAFPVAMAIGRSGKGYYYIQAYEPEFYDEVDTLKARLSTILARFSYKLPLIQIVNAPMYRSYHEISAKHVVEPGIDLTVFRPRRKLWNDEEITVGCIGRKSQWKGTLEIIQAVARAREATGRNLQLKVAFELPETVDLANYSFVELSSPHGDERLAEFYQSCDVFVATGLIQDGAFHYPCIESMASGCVVVSNYAPANVVNSIQLSQVDANKIFNALIEILKMSSAQRTNLVKTAGNDVEEYSWSIISSKIIEVFKVDGENR